VKSFTSAENPRKKILGLKNLSCERLLNFTKLLNKLCVSLILGSQLPHLSGNSASPSRELPGAGDFDLIEQRKCDEKSINSKVTFLQGSPESPPPPLPTRGRDPDPADELRIPSLLLPSSTSSESGDDDFKIEVRMII
jgi:hypothetical protein